MKPTQNLKKPKQVACTVSLDVDVLIKSMNAKEQLLLPIATSCNIPFAPFVIDPQDYESPLDAMEAEEISSKSFPSEIALRGYSSYVVASSIVEKLVDHVESQFANYTDADSRPVFLELGLLANSSKFVETANERIGSSNTTSEIQIYFTKEERHSFSKRLASLAYDEVYHMEKTPKYQATGAMQFESETNTPLLFQVTSPFNCIEVLDERYKSIYRLTAATKDY
jgi:hypothetical protein